MLNIPKPKDVLDDLAPVLPTIYEALEQGTLGTTDFFEKRKGENGWAIDAFFAAHMTRYFAIQFLKAKGYDAGDGEDLAEYKMKDIPNSGLYLSFKRYTIRIFKTKNNEVPAPGNSITKQQYYDQQLPLLTDADDPMGNLNLILLWDVNFPYRLKSLSIACPRSGGKTKDSVVLHWCREISIKSLLGSIPSTADKSLADTSTPEIEDLPIFLDTEIEIEADNKK